MAQPQIAPATNGLLAALSQRDLLRLQPLLKRVPLRLKAMLSVSTRPIDYAYFPEDGMISLVQPLAEGSTTEVGLVGREGFFGVPLLHGVKRSPIEAMVQVEGTGLRIRARDLIAEVARSETLRTLLLRYAEAIHIQTAQIAACNVRHPLGKRLMRWLLEADDRMRPKPLNLSHEFLSMMLGIRRAGVTSALGSLRREGVIEMGGGVVRIRDRAALEAATCACYSATKKEAASALQGR